MPCVSYYLKDFTRETKKLRSSSVSYYLKDAWKSLKVIVGKFMTT